jgi:putative Ca2+/H+ antiporter (TMEM165/GDT1 family)
MDWKLLATTFAAVFLAELGDKTQVAVLSLAGGTSRRWTVFVGASAALVASSLVAVLLADQLAKRIDPRVTQGVAGALLLAMGGYYVFAAVTGKGAG